MSTPALDLDNIQGDVLIGLQKKFQTFLFFTITNPDQFKQSFKQIIPLITTTTQVSTDDAAIAAHKASGAKGLITLAGTNIAFSAAGLVVLNISTDNLDTYFVKGQLKDAADRDDGLSDPLVAVGDPDWDAEFKQTIHGCFNITGDCRATIDTRLADIEAILAGTINTVTTIDGAVRPDDQAGHEHFGFQDGLSQPPLIGLPGGDPHEDPIKPGIILVGEDGDGDISTRPSWAKDSSFLVFRKLKQRVPEFNDFLNKHPILDPGLTPAQGSELLGARMVGRWKSGAPIDNHPVQDAPDDVKDNANNFTYVHDGVADDGTRCPFAAHLRKMNPRSSTVPGRQNVDIRRIIRQGIPYGPEVTPEEASSATSTLDRGLLFTCYQSSIGNGFHFLQKFWANNQDFPSSQPAPDGSGFDPIIGLNQKTQNMGTQAQQPVFMTGTDPDNIAGSKLTWAPFVLPRGGEYFLVPSISALQGTFASA